MTIRVTYEDNTTADLPEETPVRPLGTLDEVTGETCAVMRDGVWTPCLVEADIDRARRAEAERDAAVARAANAEKKLREVEHENHINAALVKLATRKDRVTLGPDGSIVHTGLAVDVFAETCFTMLEGTGAKNLVSVFISQAKTGERALVTVQRPDGKTSEELRRSESERADAAEKKLADLRAWAEERAAESDEMLRHVRGTTPGGSAWEQIVDRIDAKEST